MSQKKCVIEPEITLVCGLQQLCYHFGSCLNVVNQYLREDRFQRPGFPHIIICVFLEYKTSNFVKKLDVTNVSETAKFEGFDRESRPRPFKTMFPRSDFFCFLLNENIGNIQNIENIGNENFGNENIGNIQFFNEV